MISSNGTPTTRDLVEDRVFIYSCYQFSRSVTAERPEPRRWVVAENCLCTAQSPRSSTDDAVVDPNPLHRFYFYESSDEQLSEYQKQMSESYPGTFLPGRIGHFHSDGGPNMINVPPHFFEVLWSAPLTGVARSFTLRTQPQGKGHWAVFEVNLTEEPPELGFKRLPWRAYLRAQLGGRFWSGVITIAIGVLVALWIARLWR